jgi:SNF2-related domain
VLLRKSLFQSDDQFRDIKEIKWKLVVIDEFHNYKGKKTKIACNMRTLKEAHNPLMLGMSGTLMQNNHKELWNLVDLIETGFLGTEADFNENIGKPISYGRYGWWNRFLFLSACIFCHFLLSIRTSLKWNCCFFRSQTKGGRASCRCQR